MAVLFYTGTDLTSEFGVKINCTSTTMITMTQNKKERLCHCAIHKKQKTHSSQRNGLQGL